MSSKSGRRNEERIGAEALDKRNWPSALFIEDCTPPRWPAGGCPTNQKCRSAFQCVESQANATLALRTKLFQPGKSRSMLLIMELKTMVRSGTIQFAMSGTVVCKSYYRLASGFTRQMFDACVHNALLTERALSSAKESKIKKRKYLDETLAALDLIFSDKSIKQDPTKQMTKVHIRSRWRSIYENDYKRLVPKQRQVSYDFFVATRKRERPQYMKSPRMRKGKQPLISIYISES